MKSSNWIESLIKIVNSAVAPGLVGAASCLVALLLEELAPPKPFLPEATVHLPARGKIFVATFWGANGKQVWRSTGSRNRREALRIAQSWERQARLERSKKAPHAPVFRLPAIRTQEEVARLMRLSVRSVAQAEKEALDRLRHDPELLQLWAEYRGGSQ